jgi:hypothetical protein
MKAFDTSSLHPDAHICTDYVFGATATSVDEWGAEGVGAYLLSELKLLALFGHSNGSRITGHARKCS